MTTVKPALPLEYWQSYSPENSEINFISNFLFDTEVPLTEKEIVPILIKERIRKEREDLLRKRQGDHRIYLPKETYQIGERLTFPALEWKKGVVTSLRAGANPAIGNFTVLSIDFQDGTKREYAAGLEGHKLNAVTDSNIEDDSLNAEDVIRSYGQVLEEIVRKELQADTDLVKIAGRWFPRALLVDISIGHLNLAEAILEEAGGSPLPTGTIITQVGIPSNVSQNLLEFSMNFALQEDGRFDEVGPSGEVLWCLKRLEPTDVQLIPSPLRYLEISYERSLLSKEMLTLLSFIDDELDVFNTHGQEMTEQVICLTYPHWRAGTLPVSPHTRRFFPTAYESERVRFLLIDDTAQDEIAAWVVRRHGYVAGLKRFYQRYGVIPGSYVWIKRDEKNRRVTIGAKTRRPTRDWVRTVLVGSDGGIVFANLKQNLTTEVNDRMVIAVPDVNGVDVACEHIAQKKMPFDGLVFNMMQELTKLNVQGHVHAQELYSAVNIVRRCPAGPLLTHLSQDKKYRHVGDLHFRLAEEFLND